MKAYLTKSKIEMSQFFSSKIDPSCGGVVTFSGVVRNHHQGKSVLNMKYEAYEPMAEKQIEAILAEAKTKFGVHAARLLHRLGEMQVGDVAVAIEVVSAHRAEAFEACRYVIDQVKLRVPIWKHEFYEDGTDAWVLCTHEEVAKNA